jgi:fatty-acid desaturase
MNENFTQFIVWYKQYTTSQVGNICWLNLHRKHNTRCETVAKIQDKQVTKLQSDNHV